MRDRRHRKKPINLISTSGLKIKAFVQSPPHSPLSDTPSPPLKLNQTATPQQSTSSIFKAGLGTTLMCLSGGSFYYADTATAAATTISLSTELLITAYTLGGIGLLLIMANLYNHRSAIYNKLFSSPRTEPTIRERHRAMLGLIPSPPLTPR